MSHKEAAEHALGFIWPGHESAPTVALTHAILALIERLDDLPLVALSMEEE